MRILCVNVNKLYKVITCYNLKYKQYWYCRISNWPWQWLRQDVVEELEHRADELRFTDWAPQLGDDMRRRQDCALDCPGLPSLDCHCRTNICAMRQNPNPSLELRQVDVGVAEARAWCFAVALLCLESWWQFTHVVLITKSKTSQLAAYKLPT